jgi:2'-5' RNA ligase
MGMKFILHTLLSGEAKVFQERLVGEIFRQFGVVRPRAQNLPAHFTLKYWFETTQPELEVLEDFLETFCRSHRRAPVLIHGFSHFQREVVFMNVEFSREAIELFRDLTEGLKRFPWMQWDRYDGENLVPHVTVASKCGHVFEKVWEFVKKENPMFHTWLDNIALLRTTGMENGVDRWEVERVFRLAE